MEHDQQRLDIIASTGHVLVLGGPGSGKTHIALLKAAAVLRKDNLLPGQTLLFLSFARATVARLAEKAEGLVGASERKRLELNTYHGFAWNLLRSHGYLLQDRSSLKLLPPPEAASHLSTIPRSDRDAEKERLFTEEGILHFDLFARKTASLLTASKRLCKIICSAYPVIILDEFQDTNADEWAMIQALGQHSHLVALADADQRIYEFRGADPKRIAEFITRYSPAKFDFGTENNRSNGTDITQFGNDLITGANLGRLYQHVKVSRYGFYRGYKSTYPLKTSLCESIARCHKRKPGSWSIAVLVPSKRLMLAVSSYLESELDGLPSISHEVALDTAGPALAATLIAFVLECATVSDKAGAELLHRLCQHIYGRKGDKPANTSERALVDALRSYNQNGKIKGSKRIGLVAAAKKIITDRVHLDLKGDPGADWLSVRQLFADSGCMEFQEVANDAKYLRLLHKGALLRARMSEIWRKNGSYAGVEDAVREALLQEHLSSPVRVTKGVCVMTIHKSKGKEFTEVILYEDGFQRYVRAGANESDTAQARLTLRVGVTRAECRAMILTPRHDACPFI